VLLYAQNKYREAAEAYRRAIEINPFYADSHCNLAYLLAAEGRMDEAAKHFRLAIENKPNLRLAHFGIGKLLLSQGKNAEAFDHLLKTVTVEDEETPRFMYTLAAAYQSLGDRQNAEGYAQQARIRAVSLGQTRLVVEIERLLRELREVPGLK
jgi:tetratricopeptide (TPR) repeat protein